MPSVNLPTDLLRTFITVCDLGGFTKAADVLNRTQPAISLQMKRLETLVDAKLLRLNGRNLELTEDGKMLTVYARQMLQFNDEAVIRLRKSDATGRLRIGLPTDYALGFLQKSVTSFIHAHPEVDVEIHCDISRTLLDELHADLIDLAIVLTDDTDQHYMVRVWEEQPVWVGAKKGNSHNRNPLPIVSHPDKCEYRNRVVDALNNVGREWRIAYSSPGITGLQNAVSADLGVCALTKKTVRSDMQILTEKEGLPPLAPIQIGLLYKLPRLTDAGQILVRHLIAKLDEATDTDFRPSTHPSQ